MKSKKGGLRTSVKRFILLLTIFCLCTAFLSYKTASAQTPRQGLAVTPPTFELSANPGDVIKNSIRVDNLTDSKLSITVDRKNFAAIGEEGQVDLNSQDSSFSLASWIQLDTTSAELAPKGSKTFNFTIKVPNNAEPGGRFGSILFKVPPTATPGGVAVGQEIGSLLLLRVAGKVTEHAHIESFAATESFREYGPVSFETRIKNTGNVHVKPTGTITITDFFGNKVATIPIEAKNILPGAVRKTEELWSATSLFGKYTATLSVQYGSNQQLLTASTTFVVIPYKLVLVWLTAILVAGILIFIGRRRIARSLRILFGKE